jgi:hypothetical protein
MGPLICPFNQADRLTLSKGSWESVLPLSHLQTMRVTELARSASNRLSSTCFRVEGINGETPWQQFRAVSLVGHNLTGTEGSSTYRWRVYSVYGESSTDGYFDLRAKPNTIASSTNLTGTVANVQDDPENLDGTRLTATSATTNTQVRFTYLAGNCGVKSGAGLQSFRIRANKTPGGNTPTLTVDLYRSGGLVANLATGLAVSGLAASPSFHVVTWNGSLVAGAAAEDVEVRLTGTATVSNTVEYQACEFVLEPVSLGFITVTDSDWMVPYLPRNFWRARARLANLYLIYTREEVTPYDQLWLQFDAQENLEEYFEAGRLAVVENLALLDVRDEDALALPGIECRIVDPSTKEVMGDGSKVYDRVRPWKELSIPLGYLNSETGFESVLEELGIGSGITGDCLWIPFPENPAGPVVWGPVKDAPAITAGVWAHGNYWDAVLVAEER